VLSVLDSLDAILRLVYDVYELLLTVKLISGTFVAILPHSLRILGKAPCPRENDNSAFRIPYHYPPKHFIACIGVTAS